MKENGATALGPALTCAVGIASQIQRSEIILCTDGISNVGLGTMENKGNIKSAKEFYRALGSMAKDNGNTISIIGIEGEDCGISILGECAELTSGEVTIVKPFELQRKMRQIIDNPVVATDVKVNILMHPYFGVKKLGVVTDSNVAIDVGNVTELSDLCFRFGLTGKGESLLESNDTLSRVPIQIQVHYRKLDGTKCMRVFSRNQKISTKRERTEKYADVAVLSMAACQSSSRIALEKKDYESARETLFITQRLLDKIAVTDEQQEEYDIYIQKKVRN